MSETHTTPPPELLSDERLAEIQAFIDYEWPHAGSSNEEIYRWRDADDLLAHAAAQAEQIRLLTMRADSADWGADEIAIELRKCKVSNEIARKAWRTAEDAETSAEARAAEAEAQVAMLKVELAEQEAQSKQRGGQLFTALSCLAAMWNQYCPPPTKYNPYPGHCFMSAGEETEELLDFWGMLRADETAIDPECHWEEVPEKVKALQC